jgi:predicted metal-binding membrane protein
MNFLWIAALAAFVLVERLAPREVPLGRIAGLLLILWGTYEVLA